jgi:hypothetical protein
MGSSHNINTVLQILMTCPTKMNNRYVPICLKLGCLSETPENPETDVHLKTAQFYETAPIRDMDLRLEKI